MSEICNRIIVKCNQLTQRCKIMFVASGEELKVIFEFEDRKPDQFRLFDEDDVFGLAIVNSLMDDVLLESSSDSKEIISLSMRLKENSL